MDATVYHAPLAWLGGESLTADVAIRVANGTITSVTTGEAPAGATRLDGITIPGMASAHSHAFHRALRGKTHLTGGDFWTWRDLMYRVAGRLEPETYEALATGVFTEMLLAGITAVGEFHYLHHRRDGSRYEDPNAMGQALVSAARTAGIRLTLLDTCYLTADAAGSPVAGAQLRFTDGSAAAWADRVRALRAEAPSDVVIGVAAHSVRAVPRDELGSIAALAAELDAPLHVHLSEQRAENDACVAVHGVTPTRLLHDAGVLGSNTTAIHATHTNEEDIALLAATSSGVCLCPTTERDLGDGIGPGSELAAAGVSLSLGSDSNAVVDLFAEAAAVEHHDRLRLRRRGIHAAAALMTGATVGGMRSCGRPISGPLGAGGPADFVVIGVDNHAMTGFEPSEGVAGLVFRTNPSAIQDVYVGGKRIIESGRHVQPMPLADFATVILELTA